MFVHLLHAFWMIHHSPVEFCIFEFSKIRFCVARVCSIAVGFRIWKLISYFIFDFVKLMKIHVEHSLLPAILPGMGAWKWEKL